MTHKFTFTKDQYDEKYNTIKIDMPYSFFIGNIKHRLDHGQHNIQSVDLESPTGKILKFENPTDFLGGMQYKHGDIALRLIKD